MSSPPRAAAVDAACWAALAALAALAAPGCHDDDWLQYGWDDRRIVCSHSIDDLTSDEPWSTIDEQLDLARRRSSVALLHAHSPGRTVSLARLTAVLDLARRRGLDLVTYADLADGAPPRAGLALAFDDHAIGDWFSVRELLAARGARVTLFVSAFFAATDEERAQLAQLAADGHSIQAHSVHHLSAPAYVAAHGLDAYLADEALPSITILREAGYAPAVYAYPFGSHTDALDAALLEHVDRVRVGPRPCPH